MVSLGMQNVSAGKLNFMNIDGIVKPAVSGTVSILWKMSVATGAVLMANSYIAFTRVN